METHTPNQHLNQHQMNSKSNKATILLIGTKLGVSGKEAQKKNSCDNKNKPEYKGLGHQNQQKSVPKIVLKT